jgi:putative transcriptional regulator
MSHFLVERATQALEELRRDRRGSGLSKNFGQDVKALRTRLGLTQAAFADRYGIAIANLRNWEQENRVLRADSSARTLISMISADPKGMAEIMGKVRMKELA